MTFTLYGIKSCDSCRNALKWLEQHGFAARFHDFRQDGYTVQMLERWSDALGWEILLNKRSLTWRKIPQADRSELNAAKAIALMLENPTLIKRPILESGKTVSAGFTPEAYAEQFARKK
ncbi:MAG: arsenate reductase [Woeseia sp.]|jgi:arsenate reductase